MLCLLTFADELSGFGRVEVGVDEGKNVTSSDGQVTFSLKYAEDPIRVYRPTEEHSRPRFVRGSWEEEAKDRKRRALWGDYWESPKK